MPASPATSSPGKRVRVAGPVPGSWLDVDLENGSDLSIPVEFSLADPNLYGIPHAVKETWQGDGITGDTRNGGSCNVDTLTITPHCHGTHTECIGHVTDERVSIADIAPKGLLNALIITLTPESILSAGESSRPALAPEDVGITKRVLRNALTAHNANPGADSSTFWTQAIIIRTYPNLTRKKSATYSDNSAPFFSIEAIQYIIDLGIKHILVDLPSLDRLFDDGEMAAHRTWWELEPRSHATPHGPAFFRTITELLYIPDSINDGLGLLSIQIPPFQSDAAPSRPLYFEGRLVQSA